MPFTELGMVRKALAAVAGLVQLVALDHGAHGAVDDQDALGSGFLERGDALLACHALTASLAGSRSPGRSPSRWQMA